MIVIAHYIPESNRKGNYAVKAQMDRVNISIKSPQMHRKEMLHNLNKHMQKQKANEVILMGNFN